MRRERPSTSSKAAKKRYRLKKRNKRKLLKEKLQSMCPNEIIADANVTTTTRNAKPNKNQNKQMPAQTQHRKQQRKPEQNQQQHEATEDMVKKQMKLWQKTYLTLTRWQLDSQTNYWRQRAEQLEIENDKLKRQLRNLQQMPESGEEYITSSDDEEEVSEQYETSSEEELPEQAEEVEEEEVDEIHPGYLEFLKQTHKHWAERDAARAAKQNTPESSKISHVPNCNNDMPHLLNET